MNFQEHNLIQAAHELARTVVDFRSIPGPARVPGENDGEFAPGSAAWEHLIWSIGDFQRRYYDLCGDPHGDICNYQGVELEDGALMLRGERGVILSELVARAIELKETDLLVVEVPGNIPPEAREQITKQVHSMLGKVFEDRPVVVLANGMRMHQMTRMDVENALRDDAGQVEAVAKDGDPVEREAAAVPDSSGSESDSGAR